MNLKNIRNKPDFIDGIGNVYPITLENYEEFEECAPILYLSNNHFQNVDGISLLELVIFAFKDDERKEHIVKLEELFKLVLHKNVTFTMNENNCYGFIIENEKEEFNVINNQNYEELRTLIMNQNLLYEQKVYKNPLVQEWANKVLESKKKDSAKITLEDILTTVSIGKCKNYEELDSYSIYQLYSDYYRIRKFKNHDSSVLFRSVSDEVKIEDFAEDLDLYRNPYDDLFVSSSKLDKFNAIT